VYTTGYRDLQGGTDPNLWYTKVFSGTSSASPIVASAAAVLISVAEGRGTTLSPATVRSMLAATGQPQQFGLKGDIGPLPNLKAAINALGPRLADGSHTLVATQLGATTVPVQQNWTNLTGGTVQYDLYLRTDAGAFIRQTLLTPTSATAVFQLERNHDYQFAARAKDAAGIWGDWAFGATFSVGEYQENYSATNLTYTGTWTRSQWAPSSDGWQSVSSTAGNKATFTFTGTSVAWIATRSTNRGQANVWVDGFRVATVDLYSATTTAQVVAYATSWTTSGTHTVVVEVVGTAGRPSVDIDAFVRLR
jgi:hypothetical protein